MKGQHCEDCMKFEKCPCITCAKDNFRQDDDSGACCYAHNLVCDGSPCEDYIPDEIDSMKNETYSEIHFAIKDMLEARKSYPEMYTDDRIALIAISVAAMEEPDAPVAEVYQAVRTALIRCTAEAGDGQK